MTLGQDSAELDPVVLGHVTRYLGSQRWFGGKNRSYTVTGVQTLAWLRREFPAVRVAAATVQFASPEGSDTPGDVEVYQLPLLHAPEDAPHLDHAHVGADDNDSAGLGQPTVMYDALHAKEVTGLWLEGIAAEREVTDGPGSVQFRRAADKPEDIPVGEPSLVHSGEQTNTSLAYGQAAILKIFRRLDGGLNPDIELSTALAGAGSEHIAPPLGWVEGTWHLGGGHLGGGEGTSGRTAVRGSLGLLLVHLKSATDGWPLAAASVRDLLGEADLHADEVGGDFAGESFRLGVATAEVHRDLARALETQVADPGWLNAKASAMRIRLERAVAEVAQLEPYAERLARAFDELTALSAPVTLQRVHGDFHLGQVLRTLDGWKILDFEGEPAKPLAERQELDCALRDVAGMLRSFDYAARHMLTGTSSPATAVPATSAPWSYAQANEQREYRATEWADRNRDAFCAGYAQGGASDPREGTNNVLLRAYEIDKAVYEVIYEARNRPTWLRIPLGAVQRLAEAS